MILALYPEQNYLVFDELVPEHGNQYMKNRQTFHAKTSCTGITVDFEAQSFEQGCDEKFVYYYVHIPKSIHYHQRRSRYRSSILETNKITCTLRVANRKIFFGQCLDLSQTGLRISIKRNICQLLEKGERVHQCKLMLGMEQVIPIAIEIRQIYYQTGQQCTIVGAQIISLSAHSQSLIDKFIKTLQSQILIK